jgi:hypothetical protein
MLRHSVDDRPPADTRFVDVHFRELVTDPLGVVEAIYRVAGRELTADARTRMTAYLAANPRGKHGAHTYRLEDYGLDAQERRTALDFYTRRFDVPAERD